MRERIFEFKRFVLHHEQSVMKIGVDGVLIGSWADISEAREILDVGTGCGLIAIMCAQRNSRAHIIGIDIDAASVEEMRRNISSSPWSERLECRHESLSNCSGRFDHIVSNPPYFESGLDPQSDRELARHSGSLNPVALVETGATLLKENGRISMICPPYWLERIRLVAHTCGMHISRLVKVRANTRKEPKRILIEMQACAGTDAEATMLTLEHENRTPTEEYRALAQDFYLRW